VTDDKLLQEVTDAFNYSLKFDPEDGRMAYTVRDPIAAGNGMMLLHCNQFLYMENVNLCLFLLLCWTRQCPFLQLSFDFEMLLFICAPQPT